MGATFKAAIHIHVAYIMTEKFDWLKIPSNKKTKARMMTLLSSANHMYVESSIRPKTLK